MKNIFNDKRVRYGTYSTFTAIVVIAIAVVINLIAGSINYKKDLTPNSVYALTDETNGVLESLTDDINIYAIYQTGQEDSTIMQILDQYDFASGKINISVKDTVLYPQFAEKYSDAGSISAGSLIVEAGDRYKIITESELYSTGDTVQTITAESKITSAIQYVTSDNLPIIYFVTGHGEVSLSDLGSPLTENLEAANYELREVNLLTEDIPDDCSILFVTSPFSGDYTEDEANKVKNYLGSDGRAVFMIDYGCNKSDNYENLGSILTNYGVSVDNPYILENNSSYQYDNNPYLILPEIESHEATDQMTGSNVLFYGAYGITTLPEKRTSTTVEPLLTTSSDSFGKTTEDNTITKQEGDVDGPFDLAVAITDNTYTDTSHIVKLVVCSGYMYPLINNTEAYYNGMAFDYSIGYGNSKFIMGCIDWLNDEEDSSVYISSKSFSDDTFITDYGQSEKIKYTCVIFLPAFIIGMGFCVWLLRRNK